MFRQLFFAVFFLVCDFHIEVIEFNEVFSHQSFVHLVLLDLLRKKSCHSIFLIQIDFSEMSTNCFNFEIFLIKLASPPYENQWIISTQLIIECSQNNSTTNSFFYFISIMPWRMSHLFTHFCLFFICMSFREWI